MQNSEMEENSHSTFSNSPEFDSISKKLSESKCMRFWEFDLNTVWGDGISDNESDESTRTAHEKSQIRPTNVPPLLLTNIDNNAVEDEFDNTEDVIYSAQ